MHMKVDGEDGFPWLLMAVRESSQFGPNELVFGHSVCSPMLNPVVILL